MAATQFLIRNRHCNVWYGRIVIPLKLREHFNGKRELRKTLGTSDRKAAKRLALEFRIECQHGFDRLDLATQIMPSAKKNQPEEAGNNENFIYVMDESMPDILCDQLVATINAHPGAEPGIVGPGFDKEKKHSLDLTLDLFSDLSELRQSVVNVAIENLTDYFVKYPFVGSVHPILRDKVTGETTEITLNNVAEYPRDFIQMCIKNMFRIGGINIQRYRKGAGSYLHWHSEIWPDENLEALHRIVFWMYFLNDVDEGGETEFFFQKRKIKPKKGTCVIAPAGFTHTHRGNIPLSSDKYIATSWLLYNRPGKTKASR